jgi:hypothetical protein
MSCPLRENAKAKNIFWQVTEEVVVEQNAVMQGILLVKPSVFLFEEGSFPTGRVLAQTCCDLVLLDASIMPP